VLGILVDDAIVVGENIYHHSRLGKSGRDAAKDGAKEVMKPVILAVLTTIAAFVPMLTLPGTMGQFARVVPIVVIVALAFSLIESLLICRRTSVT
jgi:multidrug efflux pump subunit AcrB